MIKSFADKETELIHNQKFSTRLPNTIQKVALRKLMLIDNAKCLEDLRVPPKNHLEQLVEDRKGQHSIRINDQWRVCFTEKDGHFYDVEIVDCHQECKRNHIHVISFTAVLQLVKLLFRTSMCDH